MSTSRKKLVSFDKYHFDLAQKAYKKHLEVAEAVHKELERMLEKQVEPGTYESPLQYYYNTLEASEHNTMKLSGESIAKLQTKSILKLWELDKEFRETKVQPPKLEDYSLYAETDAELERLKALETLQDAFRNYIAVDKGNLKEISLAHILPHRVQIKEGNILPSEVWLKKGRTPMG